MTFTYLSELVHEEVKKIEHLTITHNLSIEFDRWYWGSTPALARRAEVLITRDFEERTYLGGHIHRRKPIITFNDIREKLSQNEEIGEPLLQDDGSLTYQHFLGWHPTNKLYYIGIRFHPMIEQVEIREQPKLAEEFYARFKRDDRVSPVSLPCFGIPDFDEELILARERQEHTI